jgi:predicted component of type VI protein secretion system
MPTRLVALDEGPHIPLDRAMIVVGRHPQCDVRLDSLRISRHHCCMMLDQGDVIVRDLGSTNGIRINGQRVEIGRLHPGDELSIAHIRYRLDNGQAHDLTQMDNERGREREQVLEPVAIGAKLASAGRLAVIAAAGANAALAESPPDSPAGGQGLMVAEQSPPIVSSSGEQRLLAAFREAMPAGMAVPDRVQIQVIVQVPRESAPSPGALASGAGVIAAPGEDLAVCRPDSHP